MILRMMAKFKIEIKKISSQRNKKNTSSLFKKILFKIGDLADNPRPNGCIKLTNEEKYRIRVGIYRILYEINENILSIIVVKVRHRKDVNN